MGNLYLVRGSLTTNAAAPLDFWTITTVAKQRISIREVIFGHDTAIAAQGVRFQLGVLASDGTGSAFTPIPQDVDNNKAAYAAAKSTMTVNGGAITVVREYAFDILTPVIVKYPPGYLVFGGSSAVVLGMRKIVGADSTGKWVCDVVFEE